MQPFVAGVLLVFASCVSATYNGTCARELVWAPTPGKQSENLDVGWEDGAPAILVLVNASSNHYVHVTGRFNKEKAAPGPVALESHECILSGTNKTRRRDVVFSNDRNSVAVLEWLANMTQGLTRAEDLVFGPGAAPPVSSEPPAASTGHPGTLGIDDQGALVIEPLAGKAVLVAGVDVLLELHHITERIKNLRAALALCPCLAQPATCLPCGVGGCTGTPRCNCTPGWRGTTCDDNANECMLGTHSCKATGATCVDTRGSFACVCDVGYTGDGLVCSDINECVTDNGGCSANASCSNTLGSRTCTCRRGFAGPNCTNVNECTSGAHNCNIANAACSDTPGSFTCRCNVGYTGSGISCSLVEVNECLLGTHRCSAWAACTNSVGSFTCACNTGFTGNGLLCSNVDECIAESHNCRASTARCTDTNGSFTCACNAGYFGNGVSCSDIRECVVNNGGCHARATCVDTPGSWTCTCRTGYTGNGFNCTSVNECALGTSNCDAAFAACIDTDGSFTCSCMAGYTGNGIACVTNMLEWARHSGSTDADDGGFVAMDNVGRIFLVGNVQGLVPGLITSKGMAVLLVAFNSSTGEKVWANVSGGRCYGVAEDSAGSLFVTGYITSGNLLKVFLSRFDSNNGTRLWTQVLGTTTDNNDYYDYYYGGGVAADRSNPDAVYISGHTTETTGSGLSGSTGGLGGFSDAFVARFARNGTRMWVRQFGTNASDYCNAVAVFQSDIYVTGRTSGVMPGSVKVGSSDIFVARITAMGLVAWSAQFGTAGADEGKGIAVDSSGVYVTGFMTPPPFSENVQAFVARYTHAGARIWTSVSEDRISSIENFGNSVALDQNGNVLITGNVEKNYFEVFVASFNTSSGLLQWTRYFGGEEDTVGRSIVVEERSGAAYVAGSARDPMYGQPSLGREDLFLLKLQYICAVGSSWDGANCTNTNECAIGTHNCSVTNAACIDMAGSYTCACNVGFIGDGVTCTYVQNLTGVLQWTRQEGSANSEDEGCVAVDDAGRVFLVGSVGGLVDGLAFAGGFRDVFLVAYNGSTGDKLWSHMLGSMGTDYTYGVAVDGVGSVYVTGSTDGNLDGQVGAGTYDVYLLRFEGSSGTRLWTRLLGTTRSEYGRGVVVDSASPDAVYVCGYTANTSSGSGLPGSAGGLGGPNDAFVARYSSNGTRVWVRQFGSNASDLCYGIAVYQSEIYVTGDTTGVMARTRNEGNSDIFVARISALGVVAWVAQLGSTALDHVNSIAVDISGVYVTGWTSSWLSNQAYVGLTDVFVARYSHAGVWAWTRMLGTASDDNGRSIALDRRSNVLVTGITGGALGGQISLGGSDIFVANFTSGGVLQRTRLFGTMLDDEGSSITVDSAGGTTYVAGITDGSMYNQPRLGSNDLFLLKLKLW